LFWGATNNSGVFQAEDSIDKHETTYKNSENELEDHFDADSDAEMMSDFSDEIEGVGNLG
jgi:hypothetical protein